MRKNITKILSALGFITVSAACSYLPRTWIDALSGASITLSQNGNSLFHQTDAKKLNISEISIQGEVKKTGVVDLRKFYKREVFVKEAILDESNDPKFIGAFRYIGYSLFDLLNSYNLDKKNEKFFRPSIDVYVVISNDKGEHVSFSWSEIFHTINPHQIIIATEVAQIKPHKKEVNYLTGNCWKVVAANDLFSYRTIENPTSITIKSFDKKEYPINREIKPMYSPAVNVVFDNGFDFSIPTISDTSRIIKYTSIFVGMGMGYHPNPEFKGIPLKSLMKKPNNLFDREWIMNGLVCFSSIDGYRAIYSYSELFNRSDQVIPILSIPENVEDGGYYRIYLPTDFFADRSVKSLKEIYFFKD